jgi:tRNA threonylcarbamoyladenosine biosynthesis protein TsaE
MNYREFLADADATEKLGARLAQSMPGNSVVFLRGDLGAGKTSLARALLRALGVQGAIKSPTYTLIERYPVTDGDAVHLDLYRIAESAELEFLGLDDLGEQVRLWLIEWPERGGAALPRPDLDISLAVAGAGRNAELAGTSAKGQAWLGRLNKMAASEGTS